MVCYVFRRKKVIVMSIKDQFMNITLILKTFSEGLFGNTIAVWFTTGFLSYKYCTYILLHERARGAVG